MSNNLDLSQVSATQSGKETTINDQAGELDAAITENLDCDFSTGNVTLTTTEFRRNISFTATSLSTARVLTIPASIPRFFFVDNSAGTDTCTVTKGSTTVALVAGEVASFITDDTTDGMSLVANSNAAPFDIGFAYSGTPGNSELMGTYIFTRAATIPDEFSGSYGHIKTAATGSTVIDVKQNGTSIGSCTFAASGTTGTFTTTAGTDETFAAGDRLEIYGPATADATAADFSITFAGTRGT